jgi:hypothetical protein
MPIALVHDLPGVGQEGYDRIVQELIGRPAESLSDWPAEGILCHITGPVDGGWRVVDVWESEESLQRFAEKLLPAMEAAGVEGPEPQTFPVYKFIV